GRTATLVASVFAGLSALYLMWFAAALRTTLADAGLDGWGAAATAASATVGALFLPFIAAYATLAYSIAGAGNDAFAAGLYDLMLALVVLSSFPRAMLIMAGSFGFWRAGLISNRLFAACVGAVLLVLAGGTTWMTNGAWTPDGVYST